MKKKAQKEDGKENKEEMVLRGTHRGVSQETSAQALRDSSASTAKNLSKPLDQSELHIHPSFPENDEKVPLQQSQNNKGYKDVYSSNSSSTPAVGSSSSKTRPIIQEESLELLIKCIDEINLENFYELSSKLSEISKNIISSFPSLIKNNPGIPWKQLAYLPQALFPSQEDNLFNIGGRAIACSRIYYNEDLYQSAIQFIIQKDLPELSSKLKLLTIYITKHCYTQKLPIANTIKRMGDFYIDELQLQILLESGQALIDAKKLGDTSKGRKLSKEYYFRYIISIGEAFVQLSYIAKLYFKNPPELINAFIKARHVLCHSERKENREFIESILKEVYEGCSVEEIIKQIIKFANKIDLQEFVINAKKALEELYGYTITKVSSKIDDLSEPLPIIGEYLQKTTFTESTQKNNKLLFKSRDMVFIIPIQGIKPSLKPYIGRGTYTIKGTPVDGIYYYVSSTIITKYNFNEEGDTVTTIALKHKPIEETLASKELYIEEFLTDLRSSKEDTKYLLSALQFINFYDEKDGQQELFEPFYQEFQNKIIEGIKQNNLSNNLNLNFFFLWQNQQKYLRLSEQEITSEEEKLFIMYYGKIWRNCSKKCSSTKNLSDIIIYIKLFKDFVEQGKYYPSKYEDLESSNKVKSRINKKESSAAEREQRVQSERESFKHHYSNIKKRGNKLKNNETNNENSKSNSDISKVSLEQIEKTIILLEDYLKKANEPLEESLKEFHRIRLLTNIENQQSALIHDSKLVHEPVREFYLILAGNAIRQLLGNELFISLIDRNTYWLFYLFLQKQRGHFSHNYVTPIVPLEKPEGFENLLQKLEDSTDQVFGIALSNAIPGEQIKIYVDQDRKYHAKLEFIIKKLYEIDFFRKIKELLTEKEAAQLHQKEKEIQENLLKIQDAFDNEDTNKKADLKKKLADFLQKIIDNVDTILFINDSDQEIKEKIVKIFSEEQEIDELILGQAINEMRLSRFGANQLKERIQYWRSSALNQRYDNIYTQIQYLSQRISSLEDIPSNQKENQFLNARMQYRIMKNINYTLRHPTSREYSMKHYEYHYEQYRFIHSLDAKNSLIISVVDFPGDVTKEPGLVHQRCDNYREKWHNIVQDEIQKTQTIPLQHMQLHADELANIKNRYYEVDFRMPLLILSMSIMNIYAQTEPFKSRYNDFLDFEWYQFDLFAKLITDQGFDLPIYHRFRLKMLPHLINEDMPKFYDHFTSIKDIEAYYQYKKNNFPLVPATSPLFINDSNLRAEIGDLIIAIETEIQKNGESSPNVWPSQKALRKLLAEHHLVLRCPHMHFFCQRVQDYNSLQHAKRQIETLVQLTAPDTPQKKAEAVTLFTEIGEYLCNRKLSKQMRAMLEHLPLSDVIQIRDGLEHQDEHGWSSVIDKWFGNQYVNKGITWDSIKRSYNGILHEITKVLDNVYAIPDDYFMKSYYYQYDRVRTVPQKQPNSEAIMKFTEGGDPASTKAVLDGKRILSNTEVIVLQREAESDPENVGFIRALLNINNYYLKERIQQWHRKLPLSENHITDYLDVISKLPCSQSLWLQVLDRPSFLPNEVERKETALLLPKKKDQKIFLRITKILSHEILEVDSLKCLSEIFRNSNKPNLDRISTVDAAMTSLCKFVQGPLHDEVIHPIFGKEVNSNAWIDLYNQFQQNILKSIEEKPKFIHQLYYYLKHSLGLLKKIIKYPESQENQELLNAYYTLKKFRNFMAHGDYTVGISDVLNKPDKIKNDRLVKGIMDTIPIIQCLEKVKVEVRKTHKTFDLASSIIQKKAESELELEKVCHIGDDPKIVIAHVQHIMEQRNQRLDSFRTLIDERRPSSYQDALIKARQVILENKVSV